MAFRVCLLLYITGWSPRHISLGCFVLHVTSVVGGGGGGGSSITDDGSTFYRSNGANFAPSYHLVKCGLTHLITCRTLQMSCQNQSKEFIIISFRISSPFSYHSNQYTLALEGPTLRMRLEKESKQIEPGCSDCLEMEWWTVHGQQYSLVWRGQCLSLILMLQTSNIETLIYVMSKPFVSICHFMLSHLITAWVVRVLLRCTHIAYDSLACMTCFLHSITNNALQCE